MYIVGGEEARGPASHAGTCTRSRVSLAKRAVRFFSTFEISTCVLPNNYNCIDNIYIYIYIYIHTYIHTHVCMYTYII